MENAKGLRAFWDSNTSPRARHHCDGLNDWINFVDEKMLTYIDKDDTIRDVLEWGCGRGDMSMKLAERGLDVHLVDLLDSSLDLAELRMMCHGFGPETRTPVEDPAQISLPIEQIDALLCVAVIQHFPSVDYWRQVAAVWRALNPRLILIQTRHAEVNQQPDDYEKDHLFSLWLTHSEVLEQFPGYTLRFNHADKPDDYIWSSRASYEFFVLTREDA